MIIRSLCTNDCCQLLSVILNHCQGTHQKLTKNVVASPKNDYLCKGIINVVSNGNNQLIIIKEI